MTRTKLLTQADVFYASIPTLTFHVATGAAGSPVGIATTANGTAYDITLTIPQGPRGLTGYTPAFSVGNVTTTIAGTTASASVRGTAENPILDLTIPRGNTGLTPSFTIGNVVTGGAGTSAGVALRGTTDNPILDITIPRGNTGFTPAISIGNVVTGSPGTTAGVALRGSTDNPIVDFTIPRGNTGATPAFTIGNVTTTAQGSSATAGLRGTVDNPILDIGIPRGNTGYTPNLTIGNVNTGAPLSSVTVSLRGTAENPIMDITIPRGNTGLTPSFTIGNVVTGVQGSNATVGLRGTADNPILDFSVPRGNTGYTPQLTMGNVTTLNPGSNVTAVLRGTAENPILDLGIPRGNAGAGSGDVVAANGGSEFTPYAATFRSSVGLGATDSVVHGDIRAKRDDSNGVYYFGSSGGTYLQYTVDHFNLNGGGLNVLNGGISASGNISTTGNVIFVGPTSASAGSGGNIRVRDDTGTDRWLTGILGYGSAKNWSLYDIVGGKGVIEVTPSGAVGIGTTTPKFRLHIAGGAVFNQSASGIAYTYAGNADGSANAKYTYIGSASGYQLFGRVTDDFGTTTETMRITDTGNVGIGTNSPIGKLTVSNGGAAGFEVNPGIAYTDTILQISYNRATGAYCAARYEASKFLWNYGATELARIETNGNFGVGTNVPEFLFDSKRDQDKVTVLRVGNQSNTANAGAMFVMASYGWSWGWRTGSNANNANRLDLVPGANDTTNPGTPAMSVLASNNNIGIGSVAPRTNLTIISKTDLTDYQGRLQLEIGESTDNNQYGLRMGYVNTAGLWRGTINAVAGGVGADLIVNPSGGNVGIGTTNPSGRLNVHGGGVTDSSIRYQVVVSSAQAYNANPVAGIAFQAAYNSGNAFAGFGGITVGKENTGDGDLNSYMALHTRANVGGVKEQVRINSSGNVGLGTNTPQARLDVNGDAIIRGGGYYRSAQFPIISLIRDNVGTWYMGGSGTAGDNNWYLRLNAQAPFLMSDTGGNIGINTTGPRTNLTVLPRTERTDPTGRLQVEIGETTNNDQFGLRMGYVSYAGAWGSVINSVSSGGGCGLSINPSGGYVGIGTASPGAPLHVSHASNGNGELARFERTAAGEADFSIQSINAAEMYLRTNGTTLAFGTNFALGSNSAARDMTIINGKVGIGNGAPVERLSVVGNVGVQAGNYFGLDYGGSFAFENGAVPYYGFGIINQSTTTNGRVAVSGYDGVDFFTQGQRCGRFSNIGNFYIGRQNGGIATPTSIQMDNSYRNSDGNNQTLKFYLFNNGTETYGFGLGTQAAIEYHAGNTNSPNLGGHIFYVGGIERARITKDGIGGNRALNFHASGVPGADEVFGGAIAPYGFTISAGNSRAIASVAATASTTIVIRNNGAQIGTITFGANGTLGTVSLTNPNVTIYDRITIHNPSSPDATLATITILLRE